MDDFVARLDKLELPNQLAAAIEDPLLQRLLDLKLSGNYKVSHICQDEYLQPSRSRSTTYKQLVSSIPVVWGWRCRHGISEETFELYKVHKGIELLNLQLISSSLKLADMTQRDCFPPLKSTWKRASKQTAIFFSWITLWNC